MKLLKPLLLAVLLMTVSGLALAQTFMPPIVTIDNPDGLQSAPGNYYFATFAGSPTHTLSIVDNAGGYVVAQNLGSGTANDFKLLEPGLMSYVNGACVDVVNRDFSLDHRFCAGGDYAGEPVDLHEFQLDSNGDGWVMLYRREPADLSAYGGYVTSTIEMSVIQQIDRDSGAVLWQLRSDEWLTLDDATVPLDGAHGRPNHINSYDLCDDETTIVISSRNVDEVVKFDIATKTILWRMGGNNSTLTHSDGVENYKQHDARCVDDGNLISIFDNGDRDLRAYSRAVVYDVDPAAGVATLMFEYRHQPEIFANFTGNFQYLPAFDRGLVHWGGAAFVDADVPNVTEIRLSDQAVVQELHLPDSQISYRITKGFDAVGNWYFPLVAR